MRGHKRNRQHWKEKFIVIVIFFVNSIQLVSGLCGYESCPKPKPGYINVHLVAHSHDDVGWLKTVDQYYYGTNREVEPGAVQYILDSVVTELKKNPNRRFIYVETAFFWRWWRSQDEETKQLVKRFVQNGQLEFISGGWCGNDEGSTHYNALIDQMTLGMRFLNETFGQCAVPKIAWQIDTFGHSREQAFLFSQMGFDAFFIGRMDYQYKSHRQSTHEMEMIWSTNPNNIGKSAWLFTGILYNYYQPPNGFCFDQLCKDDPINDDPKLDNYNVGDKIRRFLRTAEWWAEPYGTKHTLMTMGSDFHYMNANMWFKNLDKLIKYVNAFDYKNNTRIPKVHVMYSTPSCYLQEVHKSGKRLPIKSSDFFPYSNDPYGFWSGYFSSRPTFKYFIHRANNFLQACKQLAVGAFAGKPDTSILSKIFDLAEPVAIVQHHDAITGTARQYVTDDYSRRLSIGMEKCEQVVDEAFRKLAQIPFNKVSTTVAANRSNASSELDSNKYRFCQLLNISSCAATETMTDFLVSIYNPLARSLENTYVRIPVPSAYWTVRTNKGLVFSQIVEIPQPVIKIPGRKSKAKYELVFKLDTLPGLAVENVRITETIKESNVNQLPETLQPNQKSEDIVIVNKVGVKLVLENATGLIKMISRGTVQLPLKQNFYYYLGMAGNNSQFSWRASGAYIFRPNTSAADQHKPIEIVNRVAGYRIHQGMHVTEIHQIFNEWVSQVIRLYDNSELVEFEWLVGPVPIGDNYGKEILTKYTTDLATNGVFFTDSNGRQLVKRKRNSRDYPFREYEKVAQNYYPVTSRILISKDTDFPNNKGPAIVILNDRSQGGTSMNDGEIELMLHRRLLFDDAFGVEEALNETAYGTGLVARGKHWLLLCGEGTGVPVSRHRKLAQEIFMDKVMAFASIPERPGHLDNADLLSTRNTVMSKLSNILPKNIHVLTLEPVSRSQILLRLEHFYERAEDPTNSEAVIIPIKSIVHALPFVKNCKETALGGNQWIEKVKRFEWTPKENDPLAHYNLQEGDDPNVTTADNVVIKPMEIKTFLCS